MKNGCIEAMEATFALCEAINGNELTLDDLTEVCQMSMAEGHDMAQIDLSMMSMAVERAKAES